MPAQPSLYPVQTAAVERRLPGLDHLRALAIVLVLIYHYNLFEHPDWTGTFGSFGWTGVDLFFVLSGYLIGGQLLGRAAAGRPLPLGEFFLKRALRILPAYFTVLLLYFAFPWFKERGELPPLWRFLSFTQNYGLDLRHAGAFSHAWSLCVEEQFYLLLPLLLLALIALRAGRRAAWLVPGLFVLGLLLRWLSWQHFVEPLFRAGAGSGAWQPYYQWIYYPGYTRMDGLVAGVALAALASFRPALWSRLTGWGNAWLLLGLALLAGAWFLCMEQVSFGAAVFGFPLIALGYACLLLGALSPSSLLCRLQSRITAWIAAVSYSLYLIHKPLMHLTQAALEQHGYAADGNLVLACAMFVSFLGGWLLYRLVERPALQLRGRLLRPRPDAVRVDAAAVRESVSR